MNKVQKLGCICEKPELDAADYRTSNVGIDNNDDRSADVSILQCKLCQRIWLQYHINFEVLPKLERWYKGIIAKKEVAGKKPEDAVRYLENLDWYIYGGAYFESVGSFGQSKLSFDTLLR